MNKTIKIQHRYNMIIHLKNHQNVYQKLVVYKLLVIQQLIIMAESLQTINWYFLQKKTGIGPKLKMVFIRTKLRPITYRDQNVMIVQPQSSKIMGWGGRVDGRTDTHIHTDTYSHRQTSYFIYLDVCDSMRV